MRLEETFRLPSLFIIPHCLELFIRLSHAQPDLVLGTLLTQVEGWTGCPSHNQAFCDSVALVIHPT